MNEMNEPFCDCTCYMGGHDDGMVAGKRAEHARAVAIIRALLEWAGHDVLLQYEDEFDAEIAAARAYCAEGVEP
jgi:hypothetical protein